MIAAKVPASLIRPLDLVRLRHCHEWSGRVVLIECGQGYVFNLPSASPQWGTWMPIDLLELVPGQEEEMVA